MLSMILGRALSRHYIFIRRPSMRIDSGVRMFARVIAFISLVAMLAMNPTVTASAQDAEPSSGYVVICPVEGMIDDGLNVFIERVVSESQDAKAIVFVVDTFGGRVDSAIAIADLILKAPCDTIAFVRGKGAISAGALISYACKKITMEPATNIGDAQPVIASPQGNLPTGEKEVSYLRAKMRALAETNGYNADIAQAMVDKRIELRKRVEPSGKSTVYAVHPYDDDADDSFNPATDEITKAIETVEEQLGVPLDPLKEVVRDATEQKRPVAPQEDEAAEQQTGTQAPSGDEIIDGHQTLLTLTSKQAIEYGLIETTCASVDEVLGLYNYAEAERREAVMKRSEELFRWLTSPVISSLLLLIGLAALYYEIRTPGFGLPGFVGVICLAIFLGARAVIGLAEWIDIILVVTGVVLILVEIFVLPGFGIVGVAGILCVMVGLYLSLTNVFIPQYSWDFDRLVDGATTVVITGFALTLYLYILMRFFPHTGAYSRLVLTYVQSPEEGYAVQSKSDAASAIGLSGVALTVLRPAGKGRFAGKTYDIVTRGDFIEAGAPVVIVQAEGNRYVVDAVKESA